MYTLNKGINAPLKVDISDKEYQNLSNDIQNVAGG